MAQQRYQRGRITKWNDDRGFGFIQNPEGGSDVFLHISALTDRRVRPKDGDMILFQTVTDADGRVRAQHAFMEQAQSQSSNSSVEAYLWTILLVLLPLAGSVLMFWQGGNPIPLIVYPLMSIFTYALYVMDKLRAQQNRRRISEATLHLCELLGGWPGGFLAQQVWRHKSRKTSYQVVFWVIVIGHLLFWGAYLFLLWQQRSGA
jgi:uncharacterized membrane protein YsdA (DUF1294 family)/cold shock CspA family protein